MALTPEGRSICYHIENAAVKWGDFCDLSADDRLSAVKQKKEKTKLQSATEFLESRLKVCGKVKVSEVREIAEDMDISYTTLKRAKERLGLIEKREVFAGGVFWKSP